MDRVKYGAPTVANKSQKACATSDWRSMVSSGNFSTGKESRTKGMIVNIKSGGFWAAAQYGTRII